MFYRVIAQCAQALQSIEVWLDKAEQHAKIKKYDVAILMTSRLAPDQDHFITQVQFACDYVKYGAARLPARSRRSARIMRRRSMRCARASKRPSPLPGA